MSLELLKDMKKRIDLLKKDNEIKIIIIKGKGPAFCVGHDINELVGKHDLTHFKNIFRTCSNLMLDLQKLRQPVIAQVHGVALAAGCQLVAACDLAICDNKTKFSTPGVKIGLFCSTPMVPLSRLIGPRRALDMLFTGRYVFADEAKKFGLVNKVVESEKLQKETEKWANEISKYSRKTLEIGKKAFYKQIDMDEQSAYNIAKDIIAENCLTYDAQEGMSAFLDKRKPNWKDQ